MSHYAIGGSLLVWTMVLNMLSAVLRALENPSPEVVSTMLTAYWGDEDRRHDVPPHIDEERAKMLAAWRAGIGKVLGE